MAEGELIRRDDVLKVAAEVMLALDDVTELYEIVGSLRRQAVMAHDLDLVVIPTAEALQVPNEFGVDPISSWDLRITELLEMALKEDPKQEVKHGEKIINFKLHGIPVDIYVATEETYECLRLIRTGSEDFNVRLAIIAKSKNWQLKASGEGLWDLKDNSVIATGEKEILEKLLGHYPDPVDRN